MDDLLHLARTMMMRAYAPYSKFHVGAAVRDEDGGDPWRLQRRERRLSARPVRRGLGHRRPGRGGQASACWNAS